MYLNFWFLTLAVWRVSSLVAREDGPWDAFLRLRLYAGTKIDEHGEEYPTNGFSKGLMCVWCNSIWFSAIASAFIFTNVLEYFLVTYAMSTLVILLDKAVE